MIRAIKRDIQIKAPRTEVWNILFNNSTFRFWAEVFHEGTHAVSNWKQGGKVIFADESGDGIIGIITQAQAPERLYIRYYGVLVDHKEDTEGEDALGIEGTTETYDLVAVGNETRLVIQAEVDEGLFDGMDAAWDLAVERIRLLAEETLVTEVRLPAPPEAVFDAWTTQDMLSRWFHPDGFAVVLCEVDARPGGCFRMHMEAPDGTKSPTRGDFKLLDRPNRIEYVDSWDDDRSDNVFLPTTVLIDEIEEGTHMSLFTRFPSTKVRDEFLATGVRDGWKMFFDNLLAFLAEQEDEAG